MTGASARQCQMPVASWPGRDCAACPAGTYNSLTLQTSSAACQGTCAMGVGSVVVDLDGSVRGRLLLPGRLDIRHSNWSSKLISSD